MKTTKVIKMSSLIRLGLFMRFGLNEMMSHCFNKVSFTDMSRYTIELKGQNESLIVKHAKSTII